MLTKKQYEKLWATDFNPIFKGTSIPLYEEYVVREIQFQDYLDLFIGRQTYIRVGINNDEFNLAVLNLGVNVVVTVGLYPWSAAELGGFNNRNIKFIMIGEAAKPAVNGTFFYDINQINQTGYLDAPCAAFGVTAKSKKDKLLALAIRGVLLIDLFPFSINYNTNDRKKISIINSFNILCHTFIRISNLFNNNIELALVAPPTTSLKLITYTIPFGGIPIRGVLYPINQETNNGIIDEFNIWSKGLMSTDIIIDAMGYHEIINPIGGNNYVHQYKKIAVASGAPVPHAILLKFAFNL